MASESSHRLARESLQKRAGVHQWAEVGWGHLGFECHDVVWLDEHSHIPK